MMDDMNPLVTIFRAPWIIPVEPRDVVLRKHAVVVENTRIVGVLPEDKAAQKYPDARTLDLDGQVLLPGLVNAHAHSPVAAVRRLSESDIPVDSRRWPSLQRHVSPGLVKDAATAAGVRMLAGGVTCCADTYFFPEAVTAAMLKVGMRACIGLFIGDEPHPGAADLSEALQHGGDLRDEYKYDQHITFAFVPHSLATLSDKSLERTRMLADEMGLRLHAPLHETAAELDESIRRYGARPLERLDRLGGVAPFLTVIHMEHFDDAEAKLLSRRKCVVVRCPTYGDLFHLRGRSLRELGATRIALGNLAGMQGCPFDLFGEMRRIAQPLFAFGGPSPGDVLAMATVHSAHALGLGDVVGSLTKGKAADMIALRCPDAVASGETDVLDFVTREADASRVRHVWVGGRQVLHDGAATQIDEDELKRSLAARMAKRKMRSRPQPSPQLS